MYRRGTVIVVGAGASFDLGFPLGRQLKSDIYELLRRSRRFDREYDEYIYNDRLVDDQFDQELNNHLTSMAPKFITQTKMEATQFIREAMPFTSSIDNFLKNNAHRDDVARVAKAAIAWIISGYEQKAAARIAPKSRDDSVEIDTTWHQIFIEDLFANCQPNQLSEALSRVQIISFNYDRCVQQVVLVALSRLYQLTDEQVHNHLTQLQVHYPYGSLGDITDARGRSTFGDRTSWRAAATKIRTFGESEGVNVQISEVCAKADRIVFLGFGFHQPNIELLAPKKSSKTKQIFGTSLGLEPAAQQAVKGKLAATFRNSKTHTEAITELKATTCRGLLDEYRLALVD